ncbi:MAG: DNA polymerase I [Syntrophobacterales bacterium]|jgi:DNA polymerase-1|nr:DNA polymerase I [Syntrophobacterales bacterium]
MSEEYESFQPNKGENTVKRVFLVDGNSYLYRAFFATPHLSNSRGLPTNATYAFMNMIKKLLNEEKPDNLVVIFDSKGPTFREEILETYKEHRPPMPGNLAVQIPYVKKITEAMGLPIREKEGVEADDVIGTIVERLKEENVHTYIVTSDKDMMQLVSKRVSIYDSMKNLRIGPKEVEDKLGVKPSLVIDYLALAGDTSDNIPGVPGVGNKTARELVATHGDIDSIYGNLDAIKKPSVAEKLRKGKDLAHLSKDLATIRLDVECDVAIDIGDLTLREPDLKALRRLFRELEFTTLYKEIKIENVERREWPSIELSAFNMERIGIVATFHGKNSGDPILARFTAFDGTGIFYSENEDDMVSILTQATSLTVHNLKPLYIIAANHGINLPEYCFDTMLATYLVNPLRKDYEINSLVEEYLDIEIASHDSKHTLADSLPYLFELADSLLAKMDELGLLKLFTDIEMPLIEVLAAMEKYGVKVDRKMFLSLSRDFDQRLNGLIKNIYTLAGESFNINSPQQLSRILFETLGLPPTKKTKKGYSTDIDVLQSLSALHALPREILEYRSIMKLKSTYVDVLPTLISPRTGRIHTSFNQMVVATGRLSSTEPNLQNIPIRGEEGVKIRQAFVPEEGFLLLSSDYSQIELRILAHLSQDEVLISTFLADEDVHARVAREVFGVGSFGVTAEMRRTAKIINFGIVYGISGYGLSKELGVSPKEAQDYIDAYFEKYKGVKAYIERTIREVRETGFVKTLFGRRRYIPEINNPDANIRQLGERLAMNTPIQGTAADVIKLAMVRIFKKHGKIHLFSRLIMQIHDELVFEVKETELKTMEKIVKEEMENVISLSVPLKVNLLIGKNWAEAHD